MSPLNEVYMSVNLENILQNIKIIMQRYKN